MEKTVRAAAWALALTAPLARAGEHHVPGSFPTVQQAIDASAPGDTIVVHGGTWPPILISKPLTIVGSPEATFDNTGVAVFPLLQAPCIRLSGTGDGAVRLAQVRTKGVTNGFQFSGAGPAILGGGFSELHVLRSTIQSPTWCCLTGSAIGVPAISVSIPHVVVSASTVRASDSDVDFVPISGFSGVAGPPGISAPDTVVVLDSTVTGGRSSGSSYFPGTAPPGGCPCLDKAAGGTGVSAARLLVAGSTIAGGKGGDVFNGSVPWGTAPSGPPTQVTTHVQLPQDFTASGKIAVGGTWTVTWTVSGPFGVLLLAGPALPTNVAGLGWLFLDFSTLHFAAAFPAGGSHSFTFDVPPNPALTGLEIAAQFWGPEHGLTRPVIELVSP
jgi:hypothetical protein